MPNNNQAVRFIGCSSTSYKNLQTYDENTLYFVSDTQQIFLGSIEYTKSIRLLDAQPNAATIGENGRLYAYNGNLYMCQVTGYTYVWTKIANVNEYEGTVESVIAGAGLTGGTITKNGTIAHSVPAGASTKTDSLVNATPSFGGNFQIVGVTTDEFGHVNGVNLHTVTLPNETAVNVSNTTDSPVALGHDEAFSVVTGITKGSGSHDLSVTTKQFTLPTDLDTTYTITKGATEGTIKVTPSKGDPYEVEVNGWENLAKLSDISAVFRYKGAVATIDDLPATAQTGDVYSVTAEGNQYVYAEDSGWSKFGATVDLTPYALKDNVIPRVKNVEGQVPKFDADGTLTTSGHTLEKDVPADAEFTDTVYTHPEFTPHAMGLYCVKIDDEGHIADARAVIKQDIVDLGIPSQASDTQVHTNPNTTGIIYLAGALTPNALTGELHVNPAAFVNPDGSVSAAAFHGEADSAAKATSDSNGKNIAATYVSKEDAEAKYATKEEISSAALVWQVI